MCLSSQHWLLQDEGVHAFTEYVRNLIAERAREEYSALVESTGQLVHCSCSVVHKGSVVAMHGIQTTLCCFLLKQLGCTANRL
jgi:hypothetical protein